MNSYQMQKFRIRMGSALILVVVFFAIWGSRRDYQQMDLAARFAPPSSAHPFGLDQFGSDILAKVANGAKISFMVSSIVVCLCLGLGLLIGSLAGFRGGWTDLIVMRTVDMVSAFPGFLLSLSLVAVLGPSIANMIFAMCLTGWTGYARMVRAEVLNLRDREFVQSARALGAHPLRQLMVHIWPNLLPLLAINATFGMAGTVITESGLSFLGLGAPATTPTWGQLLDSGRKYLLEAPHLSLFPGLALMSLVLGFNLMGDGLRDWLDPARTR